MVIGWLTHEGMGHYEKAEFGAFGSVSHHNAKLMIRCAEKDKVVFANLSKRGKQDVIQVIILFCFNKITIFPVNKSYFKQIKYVF